MTLQDLHRKVEEARRWQDIAADMLEAGKGSISGYLPKVARLEFAARLRALSPIQSGDSDA